MLTIEEADRIALEVCHEPIWDVPQNGRVRLQYGTQADEKLNLQRTQRLYKRKLGVELETGHWIRVCKQVDASIKAALPCQDDASDREIFASLKQSDGFDFAYQPGGRPLQKDLWTNGEVCLAVAFRLKSKKVDFALTPDHLSRWGMSEEDAWHAAYACIDRAVAKKLYVKTGSSNSTSCQPGTFWRLPNGILCSSQLIPTDGKCSTATAIVLPRVLRKLAKFLECSIWQLVLAPAAEKYLFATRCNDQKAMNGLFTLIQDYWNLGEDPLTTTPLQLASEGQFCSFTSYIHIGQQYSLKTTFPGDKLIQVAAYALTYTQHEALTDRVHTQGKKFTTLITDESLDREAGFARPNACFCCAKQPEKGTKFQVCDACRFARYCSKVCQEADWVAMHKHFCQHYKQLKQAAS
ncbi:hypothetical protein WJX73_005361 [Symbiochloris irregularis]|uniref:MYND-type domain-containing protein n=1 Tax=Symbiochloris irregularis TaxID=706552 RepID=A0AAW1NMU0_9CHLO